MKILPFDKLWCVSQNIPHMPAYGLTCSGHHYSTPLQIIYSAMLLFLKPMTVNLPLHREVGT